MKVKEEKCFPCGDYYDVEIPTPDLIAELERRRPCNKCNCLGMNTICSCCLWGAHGNHFKEAA